MNIAKGIKRLEIVLYGAWTTVTAILGSNVTNWGQEQVLKLLLFWLAGLAPVWGIAWVLKGFFGPKEPD